MVDKKFTADNSQLMKKKNKFSQAFANKILLKCIACCIIFFSLEFSTDFVEIGLGKMMDLTNPLRPKVGTFWEKNKKDQLANDRLNEIAKNLPISNNDFSAMIDLKQLGDLLEKEPSVLLSPEQFRNIYNQIPSRFAFDIISPFDFLKLSHSRKWAWTKISKGENSLSFYFLDGDKQLLMDTYPPLTILFNAPEANNLQLAKLDSMPMFQGRTFSREQFFAAFDELSDPVKLQLINNPYLLIKWEPNIRKVAISRYATQNVVLLGFEIVQNIYSEIYTFEASELAVNFLIARLNEIFPALGLAFPEKNYYEYQNYEFQ